MLKAFIDESEGDDIFVMAGYLSSVSEWAAFSDEWEAALLKPRSIRYFKFAEWKSRPTNEFFRHSAQERDEKIADLYSIIANHVELSISVALKRSEHKKYFSDKTLKRRFRSPYFMLSYALISSLSSIAPNLGISEGIDFIFDDQVMESWKVQEAWEDFRFFRNRFGSLVGNMPTYGSDLKYLPLQAADMLAGRMLSSLRSSFDIVEPCGIPMHLTQKGVKVISQIILEEEIMNLRAELNTTTKFVSGIR